MIEHAHMHVILALGRLGAGDQYEAFLSNTARFEASLGYMRQTQTQVHAHAIGVILFIVL